MRGLVPASTSLLRTSKKGVDGRAWASGSDAVLRTAMPGHDENCFFFRWSNRDRGEYISGPALGDRRTLS
jgi:hypothetical protein